MNNRCENCAHYKAFYRAGDCCFWKENEGICRKCEKRVNRDQNCDLFVQAPRTQKITVAMIDGAIDDVNYILKNLF